MSPPPPSYKRFTLQTNRNVTYLFILTLPKLTFLPNVRLIIHLGAEKLHEH